MELRHLKYFLMVAEEMNFTKAAERLMMAQPPLSRQIKDLEDELGTPLFVRKPRSLELTEAGVLFRQYALRILSLVEKGTEDVREMNTGLHGTVYIGSVEGSAPHLLSKWIAGFHEEYPNVQFNLWNGSTDDVAIRLEKGLCDVGVLVEPYNHEAIDGRVVLEEPWVAIMSREHPLAENRKDCVSFEELAPYELCIPSKASRLQEISSHFLAVGTEPRVVCKLSSALNAYELASQNVGISIYPASSKAVTEANAACVVKTIYPEIMAKYVLAVPKGREIPQVAQEFCYFIADEG